MNDQKDELSCREILVFKLYKFKARIREKKKFVESYRQKSEFLKWFEATITFIIFWDFLMFYQIFLSPQVKRYGIITYEHGIHELPHELPNDLGN